MKQSINGHPDAAGNLPNVEASRLGTLSKREHQILQLATEGLTDREIADRIDISARTVVSYWVRMRGKVGPLSRTEFVALALNERNAGEIRQIRAEADTAKQILHDEMLGLEGWALAARHKAILDSLPEPVIAFDREGAILYANRWSEQLLRYEAGQLEGKSFDDVFPAQRGIARAVELKELLRLDDPRVIGIDAVVYARMLGGGLVRVILAVHAMETPEGRIASCIVRSFIEEVDYLRRRATAVANHLT